MRQLGIGGVVLAFLLSLSAASAQQQAAPDLPVAEWSKGAPSLEDFKGQVVALVFYDDNEA
jgi:hypothetical protein